MQVHTIYGNFWGEVNVKSGILPYRYKLYEVPYDMQVVQSEGTMHHGKYEHVIWSALCHKGQFIFRYPLSLRLEDPFTEVPQNQKTIYSEVPSDMHVYSTVSADFNSLVTFVDHYLLTDSWDGSSHSTVDVPPKLLILMSTPGVLLVVWVVLLYTNLEYKTTCHHYKISHTVMKVIN